MKHILLSKLNILFFPDIFIDHGFAPNKQTFTIVKYLHIFYWIYVAH